MEKSRMSLLDFATSPHRTTSAPVTGRDRMGVSTPVDASAPTATFHPFPKLPIELRLKIWRLCLPGRRVIDLSLSQFARKRFTMKCGPFCCGTKPCTADPALLHVCTESRELIKVNWKTNFGPGTASTEMYVNLDQDIIFFGRAPTAFHVKELVEPGADGRGPCTAKTIMVGPIGWENSPLTFGSNGNWLAEAAKMRSLEEISLVFDLGPDAEERNEMAEELIERYRAGVARLGWKDVPVKLYWVPFEDEEGSPVAKFELIDITDDYNDYLELMKEIRSERV